MGILVLETLILIFCVAPPILLLGLPLLVRPDSPIPDLIAFGILTLFVLACVGGTGAYWIILPILAVIAFVAWLDGEGQSGPAAPAGKGGSRQTPEGSGGDAGTGLSDRTELRFRLWRAANRLQFALVAGVVVLIATGFGIRTVVNLVPWMMVMMVATAAFRFSFYRSCQRDERALAGETRLVEAAGGNGDSLGTVT